MLFSERLLLLSCWHSVFLRIDISRRGLLQLQLRLGFLRKHPVSELEWNLVEG